MFGLIPRITFHSDVPIKNSTSTTQSFSLTVLISCGLLIFLKLRPNKEKQRASNIVDLPAPFVPIIKLVLFLVKSISVKCCPVERKLRHFMVLNVIIINNLEELQYHLK